MKLKKSLLTFLLALGVTHTAFAQNEQEQLSLASQYLSQQNFPAAFKIYQPLAKQGNRTAQANLGLMYHTGQGTQKNLKQAFSWYQKAANQGHPMAQNNLAAMYKGGDGIAKNEKQAIYWYEKSAEQGYAIAQHNLGAIYFHKNNKTLAKKWLTQACDNGYQDACNALQIGF